LERGGVDLAGKVGPGELEVFRRKFLAFEPGAGGNGGGRQLGYVSMSRGRQANTVHIVADNVDQAVEDLARDWSVDHRARWAMTPALPPPSPSPSNTTTALPPGCGPPSATPASKPNGEPSPPPSHPTPAPNSLASTANWLSSTGTGAALSPAKVATRVRPKVTPPVA
jgi:hypothetical protein